MNKEDMTEWLEWHLNRCHFDHIHVVDNDSSFDIESLCNKYDRVSYEKVIGRPRQYLIYDDYINNRSVADWIMPIDDDEFLMLDGFETVADAIEYYANKIPNLELLAVRWKHLFPKKFHTERTGKVLSYCTETHLTLASTFQRIGDLGVKCIVHRSGKIHYQETSENPNGGHIPVHEKCKYANAFDGRPLLGVGFSEFPKDTTDERVRLIHCRFKGYSEYKEKYIKNNTMRISDSIPRSKNFLFNILLDNLP